MSNATVYIHGTAPPEQQRLAALNRLTNPAFLEFLDLSAGARVLEVGSGLGILAGEVAARLSDGSVVGVELSAEQLGQARPAANLRFVQGDAHHLPFVRHEFDVVYCRYLLEHVARPSQVVSEMHRVLRPGGRVYLQENNILVSEFWPDCPAFAAIWRKFADLQMALGGDALIGKKLFALLHEAGFADIRLSIAPEIHSAGGPGFDAWIDNLLGNVAGGADALQEHGLATPGEITGAMLELASLKMNRQAAAYFYWNRASARKPD